MYKEKIREKRSSSHNMEKASKIIKRSIHTFLQSYHCFTSMAAFLVFPVSISILLSQALIPSSTSFQIIFLCLQSLFEAAAFPASSQFFSLVNLKLSQTIFSFIFTLPFTLTFLILAKASIIKSIIEYPRYKLANPSFSSFLHLYRPVLLTHLFNSCVLLSANATMFSFLFLAFNIADILGFLSYSSLTLSAAGAVLYSVVLSSTIVICSLATIVSAVENCGGYLPVLKACALMRRRMTTGLTLALSSNLGMAALEALFQYRVLGPYHLNRKFNLPVLCEAFTIVYIYSLFIVLEVIMSCMFFKSSKSGIWSSCDDTSDYQTELDPEEKGALQP